LLPAHPLTICIREGSKTLSFNCLRAEKELGFQLEALSVRYGSSRLELESKYAPLLFFLPFFPSLK